MVANNEQKRCENEKKFENWEKLDSGGRRYFCWVEGRYGWKARYVKEVDALEQTVRFYQEIFNEKGLMVEVHEKYPVDTGHKKVHGE